MVCGLVAKTELKHWNKALPAAPADGRHHQELSNQLFDGENHWKIHDMGYSQDDDWNISCDIFMSKIIGQMHINSYLCCYHYGLL